MIGLSRLEDNVVTGMKREIVFITENFGGKSNLSQYLREEKDDNWALFLSTPHHSAFIRPQSEMCAEYCCQIFVMTLVFEFNLCLI